MRTKFQNVLLIALCIITLVSCSDNDEVSSVSLVGTWKLTSLVIESSFDFNNDGNTSRDLVTETDCHATDFITVSEDGTIKIVSGLTFISADDNLQPTHECLNEVKRTTTWTQNGNSVVIENGSDDINGSISGNTITATFVDGFQLQKLNNGNLESAVETMVLTYEKMN